MGKDPAFLWYANDWSGGTSTMNRHNKGAYMDLLMAQFNEGRLGIDQVQVVLGESDFKNSWGPVLSKKFTQDEDGKYYNKRLEEEINKRRKYSESRRHNLMQKPHMDAHMENENENEIVTKDEYITTAFKNKIIVRAKNFTPPSLEDVENYFIDKQIPQYKTESQKFIDFYSSKGWMIGKNKMKDWQAAVRNWITRMNEDKTANNKPNGKSKPTTFTEAATRLIDGQ